MSEHAMRDLVFGVQALRRQVERESVELGGALGIAAHIFPHQVGAVERVLRATEVRHLLADEVGMGKTIEALMILNALRLQEPALRALIVVPNHLRAQWAHEMQARAHERPVDEDPAADDGRRTRLAWPDRITPAVVDPHHYDLLIVDEFHSLTVTLQDRIRREARRFTHLLLVSATPPFHDRARLDELMEMLEPARAAVVGAELGEGTSSSAGLLAWDRRHARLLEDGAPDEEWGTNGAPPSGRAGQATALAHCAYRRLVRSRREDYPRYVPRREHVSLVVEPVEAEVRRQTLMWRYMRHLGDLTREFDRDLLAQRVIRSPASLRQRVTFLRGHGHEREGLLAEVAPWLGRDHGDSRLDALCELLNEIWREEPDCKVLVAAGDNLTVDDLAERLPALLGAGVTRGGVRPARVRSQPKGADSLADEDEVQRAAAEFVTGDANLLLAAHVGRLGLNLQVTRHLVLYSVPWDPQDVEQWIGRVDRLGNQATRARPGEPEGRPIRIYTIAQRGLVDERILSVIQATTILTRSISLDRGAVKGIAEHIRAAVFGSDAGWATVLREARDIGHRVELSELGSPLLERLPYGPAAAHQLRATLRDAAPLEPTWPGAQRREDALEGWLRALDAAGEYDVGGLDRKGPRRTIGYRLLHLPDRTKVASRARLGEDLFEQNGSVLHMLCDRRRLRPTVPQREVVFKNGRVHQLYFMNHGSPLHERLCDTWRRLGHQGDPGFAVVLPAGHPAERLRGTAVALGVYHADPAGLLDLVNAQRRWLEQAPAAARGKNPLQHARIAAALRADQRFLRGLLPARLVVRGACLTDTRNEPLSEQAVLDLLRPTSTTAVPLARSWSPTKGQFAQLRPTLEQLEVAARDAVRADWASDRGDLADAIDERLFVIGADYSDEDAELNHLLITQSEELEAAWDAPPTIRRRLEMDLSKVRAREEMARARYEVRAAWLEGVIDRLGDPELKLFRNALIQVM